MTNQYQRQCSLDGLEPEEQAKKIRRSNASNSNGGAAGPGSCPKCGAPTIFFKDTQGPFWRCSKYSANDDSCGGWRNWNIDNEVENVQPVRS